MHLKHLGTIFLFLLFSSLSASDSTTTETPLPIDSFKIDPLSIPLYEQYKSTSDYHFNQIIMNELRWSTLGTLAGVAVGGIIDLQSHDVFIPASFIIGGLGLGVGFLTGTVVGILQGGSYKQEKNENMHFHAKRYHFGYEIQAFSKCFISRHTIARDWGENFLGIPGIALSFRPLSHSTNVPDNFLLGYYVEQWSRHTDYSVASRGELRLQRVESKFQLQPTQQYIRNPLLVCRVRLRMGCRGGDPKPDNLRLTCLF